MNLKKTGLLILTFTASTGACTNHRPDLRPAVEAAVPPMPMKNYELAADSAVRAAGYTDPRQVGGYISTFIPEAEPADWFNPRFPYEATDENGVRQKLEVRCHAERYVPLGNNLPRWHGVNTLIDLPRPPKDISMPIAKVEWCIAAPLKIR